MLVALLTLVAVALIPVTIGHYLGMARLPLLPKLDGPSDALP